VSYPLSPLFLILNTFGPTALITLTVPLIGIWNVAPLAAMPDTSCSQDQDQDDDQGLHKSRSRSRQAKRALRSSLRCGQFWGHPCISGRCYSA